jgi:hypothetical protein
LSDDLLEPWASGRSHFREVGVKSNYMAAWHAVQIMVPQKSGLIVAISGFAAVTYTYGVIFGTSKSSQRLAFQLCACPLVLAFHLLKEFCIRGTYTAWPGSFQRNKNWACPRATPMLSV